MSDDARLAGGTDQFNEDDFPQLNLDDQLHLQRQYDIHGKDRVVGWLQSKIGVPLKYQYEADFDEQSYYESMADYYVGGEC